MHSTSHPNSVDDEVEHVDIEHQRVSFKTWIVLATVALLAFANIMFVVGAGFTAQSAAELLGDRPKYIWCNAMPSIFIFVLGPPISQISEFWGRKWIIIICSVLSVAGLVIIARASNITMLLAGFGIASIGLACQALPYTIVSEIMPRKHRAWSQAIINIAVGCGGVAAVLIGGALLRHGDAERYRQFFYINLALLATATLGIWCFYSPPPRDLEATLSNREKLARIDWFGGFLLATGLLLFSVALSWSSNPYSWSSPQVLAPFVIGLSLVFAFCVFEWQFKKDGLAHHSLFQHRNFALVSCIVFVEGLAFFTINGYFVFEFTVVTGLDSWDASLPFVVYFGGSVIVTFFAAYWTTKLKQIREPLLVGFAANIIFTALMTQVKPSTSRSFTFGVAALGAFGNGMILANVVIATQFATPHSMIAVATSFNISARGLGGTIGSVVNGAIINNSFGKHIGPKVAAAVLPLGLSAQELPALMQALLSSDTTALMALPGTNQAIIEAAQLASAESYAISLRYAWIFSCSFCAVAFILTFFVINTKVEFNHKIDAPVEANMVAFQKQNHEKDSIECIEDVNAKV